MNLHQCRLALRPRGPLEVFDLSLELLRAHPGPFVRLAALVVLPTWVALSAASLLTAGHWGWLVVAVALAPVLHAPFTVLGGRLLFADAWSVRQVLSEMVRRPFATLSATVWPLVMVALSAVFCMAPVVLVLPLLSFVGEAALLERADPMHAMTRAIRLAAQSPFGAFAAAGMLVLGTTWAVVVGEIAGSLLVGWVLEFGEPFGSLLDGVATPWALLGILAFQPIHAVYKLLLFVDVRTRVDGWDLQVGLRAARLAAEARRETAA